MNINDYMKLVPSVKYSFKQVNIKQHIPLPDENDYKSGYVIRYFCQKANDKNSLIYEIDKLQSGMLATNPFYTVVTIRWRIVGDDADIRHSNSKSIQLVYSEMPLLKMYLPNLLQFRKK